MTAKQKIANVERQIEDAIKGNCSVIVCPYCGGENKKPNALDMERGWPVCCATFANASMAVIERKLSSDKLEGAKLLGDAIQRAARN